MKNPSWAYVVGFLVVWSGVMGSYLYFFFVIAPAGLRRWADSEGIVIVRKRCPGPWDWFNSGASNCQKLYRIVALDKGGHEREAWIYVGHNCGWWSMNAENCPVEARWLDPDPMAKSPKPVELLWDKDID